MDAARAGTSADIADLPRLNHFPRMALSAAAAIPPALGLWWTRPPLFPSSGLPVRFLRPLLVSFVCVPVMAPPATAATAWDFARSAAPVIGGAQACGMAPERIRAAEETVRRLLDASATDPQDKRNVVALFDFLREAATTLRRKGGHAEGGADPDCPQTLATFTDLEDRLTRWRDLTPGS